MTMSNESRPPHTGAGVSIPYVMTPEGVFWLRDAATGADPVRLSNFSVRIERQVIITDGVEERRELDLCAVVGGQERRVTIAARQLASMTWIQDLLGPDAITYVVPSGRDHLRVGIQALSEPIATSWVFAHLGWRAVDGEMVFLTASGAMTATGWHPDIVVRPPAAVAGVTLADPAPPDDRNVAIRASLAMLDIAPDPVTVPLLAAAYLAVLGDADFGLHVHGITGSGKSQLSGLIQQHFGVGLGADRLLGSWNSTANAIEQLLFDGKDSVVVVDDFCPVGTSADVQSLHRSADQIFRAVGNRQGRQRLRQDLTAVPERPPRGLLVSTGEDIPKGHSLRARAVLVEVKAGDVDWQRLTVAQQDGATGRYAQSLTGYIQWLAPQFHAIRARLAHHRADAQTGTHRAGSHRRTTTSMAVLEFALRIFLAFATEVGAISEAECEQYLTRTRTALNGLVDGQREQQAESDQAGRFVELLADAIAAGRVHVADRNGDPPTDGQLPASWGWRETTTIVGRKTVTTWAGQGDRIGWLDGEQLLLKPDAAFAAVQSLGRQVGDHFTLTRATVVKRLAEGGMLLATDGSRQTYAVRRLVEGRTQSVLVLPVSQLAGRVADDNRSDADPSTDSAIASVLRRIGVGR